MTELQHHDVSTYLRAWYKTKKNDSPIELGVWPRTMTMAPFSMMILHRVHIHTRTSLTYGVLYSRYVCRFTYKSQSVSLGYGLDWWTGLVFWTAVRGLVTTSPVRSPTQNL